MGDYDDLPALCPCRPIGEELREHGLPADVAAALRDGWCADIDTNSTCDYATTYLANGVAVPDAVLWYRIGFNPAQGIAMDRAGRTPSKGCRRRP